MFDSVVKYLNKLQNDGAAVFDVEEVRSATAAVLCHMVTIDGRIAAEEQHMLRSVLGSRFDIGAEEVARLMEEGLVETEWRTTLFPYTMILNRALDHGERSHLFHELMQLAFADGVLERREEALLNHLRILLKLDEPAAGGATTGPSSPA